MDSVLEGDPNAMRQEGGDARLECPSTLSKGTLNRRPIERLLDAPIERVFMTNDEACTGNPELVCENNLWPEGHGVNLRPERSPEPILCGAFGARSTNISKNRIPNDWPFYLCTERTELFPKRLREEPFFKNKMTLPFSWIIEDGTALTTRETILWHQQIRDEERLKERELWGQHTHGARDKESFTAPSSERHSVRPVGDLVREPAMG